MCVNISNLLTKHYELHLLHNDFEYTSICTAEGPEVLRNSGGHQSHHYPKSLTLSNCRAATIGKTAGNVEMLGEKTLESRKVSQLFITDYKPKEITKTLRLPRVDGHSVKTHVKL